MARQIKIKDIAKMAGVSSGTVDRVLHNRGGVSESSKKAVERILAEVGYRYNIHTSAVSLTKEFNLVITTPGGIPGEYWGSVMSGIEHALNEFYDINIHCIQALYNQFDVYSCRTAFDSVLQMSPDAVIIGPTFASETIRLCNELDKAEIPYVFVDSVIDGDKSGRIIYDRPICLRPSFGKASVFIYSVRCKICHLWNCACR